MLLSEAIRLGSMLRPKTKVFHIHQKGSCAMGAAVEAVLGLQAHFWVGKMHLIVEKMWPFVREERAYLCPARCGQAQDTLENAIFHLNDSEDWTREQIADWVASVEALRDPLPLPQPMPLPKPFEPQTEPVGEK